MVVFILNGMNAAGALLGLAVGDAMGAPLEGLPAPRRKITRMIGGGLHGIRRGGYTDDTLQAIAIARSLVVCRGFCAEDVAQRLVAAYHAHPSFFGPTSSAAFDLIERGCSPETAAWLIHQRKGESRSNGSVMRGPPLGIFYPPTAVRTVSLRCSRLTHYDPVAGECSAFVNQMVSSLCRGASRERAFDLALDQCEDTELLCRMQDFGRYPLLPSLDAVEATHCAVTLFLESETFSDAIIAAVNLGGDADTVGAICGALAGAEQTLAAIPSPWLQDLQDAHRLLELAADLCSVSRP